MAKEKPTTSTPRPRLFTRVYDYATGTLTIKHDATGAVATTALSELPADVVSAFALGAYADYVVQAGINALKAGGTPEVAFAAIKETAETAAAGGIEFRTGVAKVGEGSSAMCFLVGRALVETGKTAVLFRGVRYTLPDAETAGKAMRSLWDDHDPAKKDPHTKLTGRQFFSQLKNIPVIADKLASYRPKKHSTVESALE